MVKPFLILAILLAGVRLNAQDLYNVNLLINGDAETERIESGSPGWINTFGDEPETEAIGHTEFDSEWGKGRGYGENYFRSSVSKDAEKFLSQSIDLKAIQPDISAGNVAFALNGYFGGGTGASTRLEAVFKDKDGKVIKKESTEPLAETEKSPQLDFFPRSKAGTVPESAVTVDIILHFEYPGECINCSDVAIADNLSFILSKKN
jgi:hypothetical protein